MVQIITIVRYRDVWKPQHFLLKLTYDITMKFFRCLSCSNAATPVKFQSDQTPKHKCRGFELHETLILTHWGRVTHICVSNRVPTDKPREISMIFQWYFKTKIPNFHDNFQRYKMEKHRTTCCTWSPHTSYDNYLIFLRKSVKSCYFIWWVIYQ